MSYKLTVSAKTVNEKNSKLAKAKMFKISSANRAQKRHTFKIYKGAKHNDGVKIVIKKWPIL